MRGPRFVNKFVLGFAFSTDNRVVLIHKKRPGWQIGKLNGVGGHREDKEDSPDAMEREFREETGVQIPASMWRLRGHMLSSKKWHCAVYSVTTDLAMLARTKTDEEVELVLLTDALNRYPFAYLPNIQSLIALCLMRPDHNGATPLFTLTYE